MLSRLTGFVNRDKKKSTLVGAFYSAAKNWKASDKESRMTNWAELP